MNIMSKLTWRSMWKNRNRTLVTLIGIILAATVFTSVLTMAVSARDFLIRSEHASKGAYFLRLSYLNSKEADKLLQDDTVRYAASYGALGFVNAGEEESNWSSFVFAKGNTEFFEKMPVSLSEGRLPINEKEILLPEQAVDVFSYYGLPCKVGETVTLDIFTTYEELKPVLDEHEQSSFSESYTIVGIYKDHLYQDVPLLQSILTYSETQTDALYRNLFVTTKEPGDAYTLADRYGEYAQLNTDLLSYYGATKYANYNTVILFVTAVMICAVMIAAVSMIYHSFSVSVAERTKEFGLLCSIGATKKQIRKSVFFEAAILSTIGIPIGFIFGFCIDAALFSVLGERLAHLIVSTMDGTNNIKIYAVLSPTVIFAAIAVTALTVILSVTIPAIRGSRAVPMDAVKQTAEYRSDKKVSRAGKFMFRIFGIAGMMAQKYNHIHRKKHRPVVMALTLCIVLLISATSLGQMIETVTMANIKVHNHDFLLYWLTDEDIQAIEDSGMVTRSAFVENYDHFFAYAPDEAFSEDFREAFADIQTYYNDRSLNIQNASIIYVEDAVLEEYLLEKGIDPVPYLDTEDPTALLCDTKLFTPYFQNENGEWIHYSYRMTPLDKETKSILFLEYTMPTELQALYLAEGESCEWEYMSENERLLVKLVPANTTIIGDMIGSSLDKSRTVYFEILLDENHDGTFRISYYEYDKTTGTHGDTPVFIEEHSDSVRNYKVGVCIAERPFGVEESASDNIELILPLSALDDSVDSFQLAVEINHYHMFKLFLDERGSIGYTDYCESEENARTVRMLLNVVSYGFVVLVSVLCLASALNTVASSMIFRRRDFGMLRSLGLQKNGIYLILILENLFHGAKAILLGVPIGLMIHFGIYLIQRQAVITVFSLPWQALLLSVGCVLLVMVCATCCALLKMRGENLIDALKNEFQ